MTEQELALAAFKALHPRAFTEVSTLQEIAHYTSAEAALSIISQSRQFWLRDSSCTNDRTEITFGLEKILQCLERGSAVDLMQALDSFDPQVICDVKIRLAEYLGQASGGVYIGSFTKHSPRNTDGKLSMWRAYGAENGVALILDGQAFVSPTDRLKIYTAPVEYDDPEGSKITTQLNDVGKLLKSYEGALDKGLLVERLSLLLYVRALFTKHHGFLEEEEWRVVCVPKLWPTQDVQSEVKIIRGVPQIVYTVSLKQWDAGPDLSVPKFVKRIIIGPTQNPEVIKSAIESTLKDLGDPDFEQKVLVSGIPLRR